MGRHIVEPLHGMLVVRLSLRHNMVEYARHISAHIRIGVLVDGKPARRMLDKDVEQPGLWKRLRQVAHNLSGYEVAPAPAGLKSEFGLSCHMSIFD